MAFRWRTDNGPTLNAGLVAAIFQGIRTCIARKYHYFCDFSGGSRPPAPNPFWIRTRHQDILKMFIVSMRQHKVDSIINKQKQIYSKRNTICTLYNPIETISNK